MERFGEATAKQLLAAGGGGAAGGGKAQEASMVYFPVVLLLRAPLDAGAVPAGLYAAYAAVFDQMWPKGGEWRHGRAAGSRHGSGFGMTLVGRVGRVCSTGKVQRGACQ